MFVKVQLPDDEMDAVHAMRGSVPMSAWIRDLVHDTLVASNALRAVVDAEPARGRGPVMEPAAASSEPVVYSPGREGGVASSADRRATRAVWPWPSLARVLLGGLCLVMGSASAP